MPFLIVYTGIDFEFIFICPEFETLFNERGLYKLQGKLVTHFEKVVCWKSFKVEFEMCNPFCVHLYIESPH